ncbi:hypothetical protein SEUCBS140593_008329 [Sporothrix eucalyptigena]|uniref:Uncharacterized protein n=1 Tax=Sporothrix eucalyptigena TaxID=1812306 RepID=A0ABP0CKQ4_9PEZI
MPSIGSVSPSTQGVGESGPARTYPPWSNKYIKLLCRFYEVYMLIFVYDPIRDVRIPKAKDDSHLGRRRQFLDDLAFLCEHKKGGDACTAIAIEELPDRFVYHVAANTNPIKKIVPFLRSLLQKLNEMAVLSDDEKRDEKTRFTAWCVDYARDKIYSLARLLASRIDRCYDQLGRYDSSIDDDLKLWLEQFRILQKDSVTLVSLCQLAFDMRKSSGIKQLEAVSRDPFLGIASDESSNPFSEARHYIGRLADHVRVAHRLLDHLSTVQDLVNAFEVKAISQCASVGAPPMYSNISLDSICNRMFPQKDDPKKTAFREYLTQRENLMSELMDHYRDTKTRVHAEVQIAEDFHFKNRAWADQDRYIGVSKPSCYACQLYLGHHPANLVPRASHMKAYRNWCPPLLANGARDEGYTHQRNILNEVIAGMRKSLVREVCEPRPQHRWHADSHTGITSTVAMTEAGEMLLYDMDSTTLSGFVDKEVLDPYVQQAWNRSASSLLELTEAGSSECGNIGDDSDSDSDGGALLA